MQNLALMAGGKGWAGPWRSRSGAAELGRMGPDTTADSAAGAAEVSFRIYGQNDELDYAEPVIWHVNSHKARMKAALDLVVLSSIDNAPRIVDDIRIGPTWRSVVPIKSPA